MWHIKLFFGLNGPLFRKTRLLDININIKVLKNVYSFSYFRLLNNLFFNIYDHQYQNMNEYKNIYNIFSIS